MNTKIERLMDWYTLSKQQSILVKTVHKQIDLPIHSYNDDNKHCDWYNCCIYKLEGDIQDQYS